MEELVKELKSEIIEALSLEDITPDDIDADAPLFGSGLGLDSIDALELIVLIEKKYGIKLQDPTKSKEVFKSVNVMAQFIAENRTKEPNATDERADLYHRCGRCLCHRCR